MKYAGISWLCLFLVLAPEPSFAGSAIGQDGSVETNATEGVRWLCSGEILRTRFEAGAVTVTWQETSTRLELVASDVIVRYVGGEGSPGVSLWLRPDDRAAFDDGKRVVGCRAQRRRGDTPIQKPTGDGPLPLVTALVEGMPRRLSEFEAVLPLDRSLGSSTSGPHAEIHEEGLVSSLWIEYDIDYYHLSANDETNPLLKRWHVSLDGSDDGVRDLLRSRYGEGVELRHRDPSVWRYGPFYFTPHRSWFKLEYDKNEPEWVVPSRDAATQQQEIARVERIVAGRVRREDLETEFGPLGPDPWGNSLEGLTRHWRVTVRPATGPIEQVSLRPRGGPIPAGSLIGTLGIEHPVVVSDDVHFALRHLVDADRGKPRVAGFVVEISIDTTDLELVSDAGSSYWSGTVFPIRGISLRRPDSR